MANELNPARSQFATTSVLPSVVYGILTLSVEQIERMRDLGVAWCTESQFEALIATVTKQRGDIESARSLLREAERPNRDALIVGADWMAGAINRLIQLGTLSARSECGDAMLDYACNRHGNYRPIQGVEAAYRAWLERYREPRSPARAALPPETPAEGRT